MGELVTNVGERPLLNRRGGGGARRGGGGGGRRGAAARCAVVASATRTHHLIERAPDGPISGMNGRPRALAMCVISSRTRCHCFFVISVNCYEFLWHKECVES